MTICIKIHYFYHDRVRFSETGHQHQKSESFSYADKIFFSTSDPRLHPANLFLIFLSTEFWWMFGFFLPCDTWIYFINNKIYKSNMKINKWKQPMFGFITLSGISKERIIKYWYGFVDLSLGKPILSIITFCRWIMFLAAKKQL